MVTALPAIAVPPGFRKGAGGLILPEAQSRHRRVLTKDQSKTLTRCIQKVLGPENIQFGLRCGELDCPSREIVRVQEPGHTVLRCGCRDRVLETAF